MSEPTNTPPILSRAALSRVGNSEGGLADAGLPFPDGAPVREGVPATAVRVGVERNGDLKVVSTWNEGGGKTLWYRFDPAARRWEQVGHLHEPVFDAPAYQVGIVPGDTDRDREWGQTAEVLPVSAGGALIPAPADVAAAAADEAVGVDTAGEGVTPNA